MYTAITITRLLLFVKLANPLELMPLELMPCKSFTMLKDFLIAYKYHKQIFFFFISKHHHKFKQDEKSNVIFLHILYIYIFFHSIQNWYMNFPFVYIFRTLINVFFIYIFYRILKPHNTSMKTRKRKSLFNWMMKQTRKMKSPFQLQKYIYIHVILSLILKFILMLYLCYRKLLMMTCHLSSVGKWIKWS